MFSKYYETTLKYIEFRNSESQFDNYINFDIKYEYCFAHNYKNYIDDERYITILFSDTLQEELYFL